MSTALDAAFKANDRYLWGILYRMTGVAADADDLLQDTFRRALEKPPKRIDEPLRPWLVKVAMNLARDHLRKRKRTAYVGPWLPSPIETPKEENPPGFELPSTEARYDLLESVTFAFLIALEALTPSQRAVLLLRDVFDYSVRETAEALALSEANVKTTHLRARRAMEHYEAHRTKPTAEAQEETTRLLTEFFSHLAAQDVAAIEAMLAEDVRAANDGGGEFYAALRIIRGQRKVRLLYQKLSLKRGFPIWFEVRLINGMPGIVAQFGPGKAREGARAAFLPVIEGGRIRELHSVLATRKLTALRFGGA
jgi:RNA polymerase sigma-70 factor (ECF subfamily)